MNRRSILSFVLVGAAAILHAHAQDKATPPKAQKVDKTNKAETSSDKPKILVSQPGTKQSDAASDGSTVRGEVVQRTAKANPMADGPAQMVADFFAAMQGGKIDEGYGMLTRDSKIAEKPEELKQLKAKTREAVEVFGAISGFDLVESRAVGQRLVRATYISQGKVFPLRWRFYFYKPEGSWRLIDMRVDDKLTGIFDEAEEGKPDELKTSGVGLP
jgi:hypothetical protein